MTKIKTIDYWHEERQTGQLESGDRPGYTWLLDLQTKQNKTKQNKTKQKWYHVIKWGQRYSAQQVVLKSSYVHIRYLKAQK